MRSRLHVAVAAITMSAALLAGCGDDDTTTAVSDIEEPETEAERTGAGGNLSKQDYIERGDAICGELTVARSLIEAPADETDFARYLGDLLDQATIAHEGFTALQPPAGGVEVHDALLASLEGMIEAVDGARTAAEQGDTVSAEDLLAMAGERRAQAHQLAADYGFDECGTS